MSEKEKAFIYASIQVRVEEEKRQSSELINSVSWTDTLNDGCSKLEFTVKDDNLNIQNGSKVRFKYNDANVFYGYVFKHGHNKNKEISVTAYDQLRYFKAKDTIVVKDDTITTIVNRMCNYFGLSKGALADTGYVLDTNVHEDKTWLDIIYAGVSDTLTNTGKKYCLRDEFGCVALRDLDELVLNIVLGDQKLCYDYSFEKNIDDEFYNQIKIHVKGENGASVGNFISVKDDESIKKFGLLQYFETMDNKNASQANYKAETLLKLHNKEAESISMECLGDIDVRAGSSFYGYIEDINLNKRLIVKKVTHKFMPVHTMSLEVIT